MASYPRIAALKGPQELRERLRSLALDVPVDEEVVPAPNSPLAQPLAVGGRSVGNRWCVQPMEGWDGTSDGQPSDLTFRRWQRFGESGAKLIWGGEAVAVRHEGRANPNQLVAAPHTKGGLARLREGLIHAHAARFGSADDLLVGLQLTHSGRFCRPHRKDRLEPRIAYHHPILDHKFGIDPADDRPVMTDGEVEQLVADFVRAARLARQAGYDFVDVKHCHGYLLHEFLGAHTRPGRYGGDFANRTRILREVVAGIRSERPGLMIAVRLSAFDLVPFRPDPDLTDGTKLGPGVPEPFAAHLPYRYGFGVDPANPAAYDLTETFQFIDLLREQGVALLNVTAGSPYYNPHIQRPALFPPSDGYQPPEDPLVGVARQIHVVRRLKAYAPDLPVVGSAYTYLQEYLPHVAQAVVREGWTDFVGIGRMVLACPGLPAETLAGRVPDHRSLCRTFSDCTTAPRNGMISGCFPLDCFYRERPERTRLLEIKKAL